MTLRSGSRGKRAGAHRAPRPVSRRQESEVSSPSAERPRAGKLRQGSARAGKAADGNGRTGASLGGLRSRAVIARTSVVAVLAALVGVGVAYGGSSPAEPTVYQFLLDWQSKHYLQAAKLTTGQPQLVARELASAYNELDASDLSLTMRSVVQHGTKANAQFAATIGLGGRGLVWSYNGSFGLQADGSGWQVVWHPSVIMPRLGDNERLAVVTTELPRQYLEDSAGKPLTVPSIAYQVGVIPGHLRHPASTAEEIANITQLTANQVLGQIAAAPSRQFLELVTLPPAAVAMRKELAAVPGVLVKRVDERLFDSIAPDVVGTVGTELSPALRKNGVPYLPGTTVGDSGLQQTFQQKLTGTPQTEVVIQRDGAIVEVLKRFKGTRGKSVTTTLDSSVQIAADDAVAKISNSAAIVAVQPSTGRILAVASNKPSGMPELQPLTGRYQPGQAFTIVSSAAILAASRVPVTPDSTVSCSPTSYVNGHTFANDPPEQALGGRATFQKDFAYGCSTAFVGLSLYLNSAQLSEFAAKFGVGGWQLPLSSYFAGTIGQPSGEADLAADTIGEGDVEMSPLGMALAAAMVDSGRWHPPSLVPGEQDPGNASEHAMSPQVVSDLRDLMHRTVTSGAGRAANVGGDVFGQLGNASYGVDNLRISWFVGYQGSGIAFAVVELSKSAAKSAAPLAGSFLRNIQTGS
jgi:cell division protein FtsI/penicillin-binding protein 2